MCDFMVFIALDLKFLNHWIYNFLNQSVWSLFGIQSHVILEIIYWVCVVLLRTQSHLDLGKISNFSFWICTNIFEASIKIFMLLLNMYRNIP